MNKYKIFCVAGLLILVPLMIVLLFPVSSANAATPMPICAANSACSKQKAVLRQLERTRPSKKLTRRQIINRIKAACNKMRSLDCPEIRNYKPEICFTDF